MKSITIIASLLILSSCLKNDQTCACTTTTITKNTNGSQISTTSYSSITKIKNVTRNRAKNQCYSNIITTNTYSNSVSEITTECNLK